MIYEDEVRLNSGIYADDKGDLAGHDINSAGKSDPPVPMAIEGIELGQTCESIHFLHACSWGREEPGVEVARYLIHFEDGSVEPLPVIYGKHMADFWIQSQTPRQIAQLENIVWERPFTTAGGTEGRLALTRQTWKNETHRGVKVSHIDFISAGKQAAPVLYGITLE